MFHFDNPIVTSNLSYWNKIFLPKIHNPKPVTLTPGLLSSCLQILRFTFITKSNCTKCNTCIPDLLPPFVTSYNWHITNKINLPKTYFPLFIIKVQPLKLSKLQLLLVPGYFTPKLKLLLGKILHESKVNYDQFNNLIKHFLKT